MLGTVTYTDQGRGMELAGAGDQRYAPLVCSY
jgi:hypothetical protein